MPSLGEKLRQARESQGRELSWFAEATRISERYLEAIEADDLGQLPRGFLSRSFVRQYARAVGIPDSEIAAELDRVSTAQQARSVTARRPREEVLGLHAVSHVIEGPGRQKRGILGTLATLVAALFVGAVLYAVWLYQQTAVPVEPVPAANAPAEVERPANVAEADVPAAQPEVTETGAPAISETESPRSGEDAPEPAATSEKGPLWFRLRAREETWVRVISGEKTLFVGILQADETRTFAGLDNASLRTGNAGGLEIVANGKDIGPIGPRGQIRIVTLTPEGSEIRAPEKKPLLTLPETQRGGADGS